MDRRFPCNIISNHNTNKNVQVRLRIVKEFNFLEWHHAVVAEWLKALPQI